MNPRMDVTPEVRRLHRLLEASRLLNSTLELAELTEIVLRILQDELPIERCTLFVVDWHRRLLRSLIAQGLEEFEIVVAVGEGLAGTVAATGQPLDITDAYADERFNPAFDLRFGFRTRDALSIPVFNQESLVGVLQLLNRQRALTVEEQDFLADMCTYIGLALHNAWIHHQLKESKAAQQELLLERDSTHAQKQSALSDVVVGIIHEIRNPLTIAKGQCASFSNDEALTPSMAKHLETIDTCITKAATIAQNFLDVARENTTHETTDVNSIIKQTVDRMAYEFRSRAVSIVLDLETLPPICAHPGSVQQILSNFLKSALDSAAGRGTTATVSVKSVYLPHNHSVGIEVSENRGSFRQIFSIELPVQRTRPTAVSD